MGDVVPYDRLLYKQVEKEGLRELYRIYQYTAGWEDPEPPDEEQRRLFEEGLLEL